MPYIKDPEMENTSNPIKGIGLICIAFFAFSASDAVAKFLSSGIHPFQLSFIRFVVQFVAVILLFRVWSNPQCLTTKRPLLQLFRGLMLATVTNLHFMAMQHLTLSQAITIMFSMPLLVTALSGPILNEWAGPRRWAAIVVGFIGVLVVIRPGSEGMHWASLYSVGAAICYSIYTLQTRILSQTDNNQSMLFYAAIAGSVAMAPLSYTVWIPVTAPVEIGLIGFLCVGAMGGHWILQQAYRLAPAPILAPFMYTQMIWMGLLGFAIFGDVPSYYTIGGSFIIAASGLYILYREQITQRSRTAVSDPRPPEM